MRDHAGDDPVYQLLHPHHVLGHDLCLRWRLLESLTLREGLACETSTFAEELLSQESERGHRILNNVNEHSYC